MEFLETIFISVSVFEASYIFFRIQEYLLDLSIKGKATPGSG
jgi:hypothetical protein